MVTKASTKRPTFTAKGDAQGDREARLAKALRENLKRRKEQARVRKGAGGQDGEN